MKKFLIILLLATASCTAQPILPNCNSLTTQRINHIESVMNALTVLPNTIYQDGTFKAVTVTGLRFFDEQTPELTKAEWGVVINKLFERGYMREQIQIVSPYRIGAYCPPKCAE